MTCATAIVNIHKEGLLLAPTLNSLRLAKQNAVVAGYEIELLIIADNADQLTVGIAEQYLDVIDRIIPVEFADLGASREYGITQAKNDWVFLHDGDDLFSSNWFTRFFEMQANGEIDDRTIYHTSLFARFGVETDIRQMIDSWDARFHPLFLASEWYFSNKSVLNRKIFDDFPMPYNDKRIGIGNEDWTWSCHTINAGIRHSYLPETICFYRTKSAETSLGLTPGMIHDASPLFDPENILRHEIQRAERPERIRAFADSMTTKGNPVIGDGLPADWFWHEVTLQGAFESLISDYLAVPHGVLRCQLPNLHYNVVSATQFLMRDLDERPKIFIFATMENLCGADKIIELFLKASHDHNNQSHQPVLVVDEGEHVFSDFGLMGRFGAKVICTSHFQRFYRPEEYYHNRLLMRPMVQFKGSIIIDLGSDTFARLFQEFHRVLLENFSSLSAVLFDNSQDVMSPALNNIAQNLRLAKAHNGKEMQVYAQETLVQDLSHNFAPHIHTWPDGFSDAVRSVTQHRFRSITHADSFDLHGLLTVPEPAIAPSSPALSFGKAVGFQVEQSGEVEFLILKHDRVKSYLYKTGDTWMPKSWYLEALEFLRNNKHIWIVPPQISVSKDPSGKHTSRWNTFSKPQDIFSVWYDQCFTAENMPIAVITREPICKTPPKTAAELAKALYYYCADPDKKVSACGETLAIATGEFR
ncbi:MAG: glycosyltransferase [Rhodobacteraceae bacterium]|nr:glycosyltransferase [Paracoccaceae bacterium]